MARRASKDQPKVTRTDWLEEVKKVRPEVGVPGYWKALGENTSQWAEEANVCRFWKDALEAHANWASHFRRKTGAELLAQGGLTGFCGKSASRLESKAFQESFRGGALDPLKVWSKAGPPVPDLNDMVRTRVKCRFLDGVEFMGDRLVALARSNGLKVRRIRQGKLEGYFAQHVYVTQDVLFRFGGGSAVARVQHELQIATELATTIWDATHGVYEASRETPETPAEWQWNAQDPRFMARQIGHMMHLADGLLVQLREAVKGKGTKT